MQSGGALAGREQARHSGHLGIAIHFDAAHHVMRGGADFHGLFGDIDVRELLELVKHAGQLFLNMLGGLGKTLFDPRDIQKHASVRAAAALFNLAHYAARDVVSREQLRRTARVLVPLRIAPALLFVVGSL